EAEAALELRLPNEALAVVRRHPAPYFIERRDDSSRLPLVDLRGRGRRDALASILALLAEHLEVLWLLPAVVFRGGAVVIGEFFQVEVGLVYVAAVPGHLLAVIPGGLLHRGDGLFAEGLGVAEAGGQADDEEGEAVVALGHL